MLYVLQGLSVNNDLAGMGRECSAGGKMKTGYDGKNAGTYMIGWVGRYDTGQRV